MRKSIGKSIFSQVKVFDLFALPFLVFWISDGFYRQWSDPSYSHGETVFLAVITYSALIVIYSYEFRLRRDRELRRSEDKEGEQ